MNASLEGRVAVVTGAATGIGRSIALGLASEGAAVVVADVDGRAGRETAAAAARRSRAVFAETDVGDVASVDALAATCATAFGPADILCNNAGVVSWQALGDLSAQVWDELVNVNLRGVLFTTRAFLPQLESHGRASVVNIASTSALVGAAQLAAYSATKGGVVSATRALAVELAPVAIRVNAICPGAIDTAIMDQALARVPGATRAGFAASNPLQRNGAPGDVAAAAVWLASDGSAFVTGAVIVVDGGMTAAQSLNPSSAAPPHGRPDASSAG